MDRDNVDVTILLVGFSTLDDRLVFLCTEGGRSAWFGREERRERTMSNSSSFSWYSTFSSNSSNPGAYALQFSVIPVTQMWIKPREETEAMRGRMGCHWFEERSERFVQRRRGTHVEVLERIFGSFENF